MTTSPRSYICEGCKGKVAIPRGRRLTLEQVKTTHQGTCPAITRRIKQ